MDTIKKLSIKMPIDEFIKTLDHNNLICRRMNNQIDHLSSSISSSPLDISLTPPELIPEKVLEEERKDEKLESQVRDYLDLLMSSSQEETDEVADLIMQEQYRSRDTLLRVIAELKKSSKDYDKIDKLMYKLFSDKETTPKENIPVSFNYNIILPKSVISELEKISPNYYATFENLFISILIAGTDHKKILSFEEGIFFEATNRNGCRIIFRQVADSTFLIMTAFIKYCTSNKAYKDQLKLLVSKCLSEEESVKASLAEDEFINQNEENLSFLWSLLHNDKKDGNSPKIYTIGGMK